jgi:hypothetical protein
MNTCALPLTVVDRPCGGKLSALPETVARTSRLRVSLIRKTSFDVPPVATWTMTPTAVDVGASLLRFVTSPR